MYTHSFLTYLKTCLLTAKCVREKPAGRTCHCVASATGSRRRSIGPAPREKQSRADFVARSLFSAATLWIWCGTTPPWLMIRQQRSAGHSHLTFLFPSVPLFHLISSLWYNNKFYFCTLWFRGTSHSLDERKWMRLFLWKKQNKNHWLFFSELSNWFRRTLQFVSEMSLYVLCVKLSPSYFLTTVLHQVFNFFFPWNIVSSD